VSHQHSSGRARHNYGKFNGHNTAEQMMDEATRLHGKDGKLILCTFCSMSAGTSGPRRPLVRCDEPQCLEYWHLDCLDPPAQLIPRKVQEINNVLYHKPWMCPHHLVHDQRIMHHPYIERTRFRRPRVEKFAGYQNNGNVEVIANPAGVGYAPATDEQLAATKALDDPGSAATVRIPENVIVTNFVEAAKR
jgi:hypothetical protein